MNIAHPKRTGCPRSGLRTGLRGFTLIELLVVIAIIAILAALLLPALGTVKKRAQAKKVQMEVNALANAIHTYESDYSKFPVSSVAPLTAMSEATRLGEDFTFGTKGVACAGPSGANAMDAGFSTPAPSVYQTITTPLSNYQTNNSEVMSVLMDVEFWPASPTVATINQGHAKNPHRTQYLNATMAGNNTSAGVGPDGVYRDLWGNPYMITIDLNFDEKARDAFYRLPAVSADPTDGNTLKRGLNGLIPKVVGGNTVYEANSPVMVWSAGPDKLIDPATPATQGVNKDNIISWKQ
jgi:prepilin-type N-terminal cleavage/methylation domain-containing protein